MIYQNTLPNDPQSLTNWCHEDTSLIAALLSVAVERNVPEWRSLVSSEHHL